MSGFEVLGAISASVSLLESAISLIERIRKASDRGKNLEEALTRHSNELKQTSEVLQLIKDENTLQTAGVVSHIVDIEKLTKKLNGCLEEMNPEGKGRTRQFFHNIGKGQQEDEEVSNLMNDLANAKSGLILRLQVANIGLTRTVYDEIAIDKGTMERIDQILQRAFGPDGGLKFAELVKKCQVDEDGLALPSKGEPLESRIVIANMTEDQALQINGPLGKEGWREVSQLEIRDNRATGKSIQVNHGTSMDVFEKLLAARKNDESQNKVFMAGSIILVLLVAAIIALLLK